MLRLIAHRTLVGLLTLLGVSILIFGGVMLLPGDVATALLGQSATPETVEAYRQALHLHDPALLRYWHWLTGFMVGDLGTSLANGRSIAEEIAPRLGATFFLAGYAAVIAVPLSVGLGIIAAIRQGSVFDRTVNIVTLSTISMPEFFIGYILISVVAVQLGWLPSLASINDDMGLGERLYTAALPAITLVLVVMAHMMRMTRAAVISAMSSPYVEMAILKGLRRWRIVVQHALPNALAPIINVIALNLAYLVVGVIVVEVVFVYPGMGQLMVDAVSKRDIPVVQACGLIFASTFVLLNMIADLLAIISNPRLRHPR
jgi:peptide/nickel transport system permease protein